MSFPPRCPHRRLTLLLPFLLLVLLLCRMVSKEEPPVNSGTRQSRGTQISQNSASGLPATSRIDKHAPSTAIPPPPADGPGRAALESDGFTPRTRELAVALDAGSGLLVRSADGAVREFLMRPQRLLSDDFQITLGDDRRSSFGAGLRSYEGRETDAGAVIHAAIAGGAFAADITMPDGASTFLRTDESTGALRELHRTAEQNRMTCFHDYATGIASMKSDQPPVTEDDWQRAPEAAIEPLVAAYSGFDPETGRLDKYVQPIAFGHNYEISLRECLSIVTLDKLATGANTTARLSQITSEYLAKAGNLASIQEDNLGVRYLLQELILTPDAAAYTDVPVSLGDYGAWISSRRPRGTFGWDLSTRFGNGGFSGGTIGVAWVRSLGTTSPVNVCQKGYDVELEAHEQGHNMGSDHSNGGIMNPGINGSRDFFATRCPDIRFIWSHGGGTAPYITSRLGGDTALPQLQKFYYDTAQAFNPYTLPTFTKVVPMSHILFGSDYPFAQGAGSVAKGLAAYGFAATDLRAIERDNALELFPRLKRG